MTAESDENQSAGRDVTVKLTGVQSKAAIGTGTINVTIPSHEHGL
jgi:hypothetical protein